MIRSVLILSAALGGCAVSPAPLLTIPEGHPGSAESKDTPYLPAPNPFKQEHDPSPHEQGLAKAPEKGPYPLDTCVVSGEKLGSMGDPVVLKHEGREVRLCCAGCVAKFKQDPAKYLKKLDEAGKKHDHGSHP